MMVDAYLMKCDMISLLNDDLQLLHQALFKRQEKSKGFGKMEDIAQTLELVRKSGQTFEREDPVERAKKFFLLI